MRIIILKIGTIVFWLAWPFWFFYFKYSGSRSRVLVVVDGEVLILKGWLSGGSWGLPGGGAHRNETITASAIRELQEEVNIVSEETALQSLGSRMRSDNGLAYKAVYFCLRLKDKPVLRLRRIEIAEAKWVLLEDIRSHKIDNDAKYALDKYRSISRSGLL